jgi:NADP-dependent 3-hydroxy acid dehydrogenase YdfG
VIATARALDTLKDLQDAYSDQQCRILQLDVTDSFDVLSAKAKEAISMWGRVDVLVNNAGLGLVGTVEEAGCVYVTHRLLDFPLIRTQGGRIN